MFIKMHHIDKLFICVMISVIPSTIQNKTTLSENGNSTSTLTKTVATLPLHVTKKPVENPEHHVIRKTGVSPVTEDPTHLGREHVTRNETPHTVVNTSRAHDEVTVPSVSQKTVHSNATLKTTVNTSIKDIKSSTSTVAPSTKKRTTTKTVPTKPMRTVHDDISFVVSNKNSETHVPRIPTIDSIVTKRNRRADYVVPIVGIILSVPLVAIIMSFVYKRTSDWWQHRNYRRMDFLIEGMYNN